MFTKRPLTEERLWPLIVDGACDVRGDGQNDSRQFGNKIGCYLVFLADSSSNLFLYYFQPCKDQFQTQ